jgi:hypothetical protein
MEKSWMIKPRKQLITPKESKKNVKIKIKHKWKGKKKFLLKG